VSRRERKDVGEGAKGRGPLPPPPHPLSPSLKGGLNLAEEVGGLGPAFLGPLKGGWEGSLREGRGICNPPALPSNLSYLPSLTPGQAALVFGAPLRPLAAAAAAWGVARGARVLVVDAANAFDPYRLVREARSRGISRAAALSRVRVARAFTSHQLVRLLKEELAGELSPPSLICMLGPVSLFYDEQIPLAERRRLFTNMVDILATYKTKAPLLLLQPPLPRGAVNRRFGQLLAPLLDYRVRMHEERREKETNSRVGAGFKPAPGAGGTIRLL
jgi:hypothetical protein